MPAEQEASRWIRPFVSRNGRIRCRYRIRIYIARLDAITFGEKKLKNNSSKTPTREERNTVPKYVTENPENT